MRVFSPGSDTELVEWIASSADRFRDEGVPIVTGAALQDPAGGYDTLPRSGVSTSGLSDVIDLRPRDLTITVGAGMRLSTLAGVVHEAGLWIPLSSVSEDRTVGGWVASAPAGEFDGSFGPVRRHLLACTLLQWNGRVTRWGRPVMKNVAGYDVTKLVCGSRARLGILSSVTVRLWPRPRTLRRFNLQGDSLSDAGVSLKQAPRFEGVLWRQVPGNEQSVSASVSVAGGPASVAARVRALELWALDRGVELEEDKPGPMAPAPGLVDRTARPATSAAYRIAFGRRYLASGLRNLNRRLAREIDPWTMEAFPATGVVRLLTQNQKAAGRRQAPGWLTTIADTEGRAAVSQPTLEAPAVRIERGGQAEHEAARRMRSTGSRDMERRWLAAFAGLEVPWQADYL